MGFPSYKKSFVILTQISEMAQSNSGRLTANMFSSQSLNSALLLEAAAVTETLKKVSLASLPRVDIKPWLCSILRSLLAQTIMQTQHKDLDSSLR